MAKNSLRSSVALGATVALASFGLVAAPAVAAETLSLQVSTGTTYNVLTTSTIKLDAGFAGTESTGAAASLKYRITNAGGATIGVDNVVEGGASATTINADQYGSTTAATGTVATAITDDDFIVNNADASEDPALGSENSVTLSLGSHDANYSLTVQAWLDLDGDNSIDTNEATSPVRTVTFYDSANVTATATFDTPMVGDATLTAYVTLNNNINHQELDDNDVLVTFYKDGTAITTYAVRASSSATASAAITDKTDVKANPGNAVYDSTSAKLKAVFTPADIDAEADGSSTAVAVVTTPLSVVASSTYSARASVYNSSTWDLNGNQVNAAIGAVTTDRIETSVVAAAGVKTTTTGIKDVTSGAAGGVAAVRVATASFSAKAKVEKSDDTSVGSGKTVRVTVTASGLAASDSVTVGGKAITAADTISLEYTTDSNGEITVPVTSAGADATETLVFNFEVDGVNTSGGNGELTVTFTAVQYTIVNLSDMGASTRNITSGGSLALQYAAVDQWGAGPGADHFIYLERAQATARATTNASWIRTADISSGKASVTITDNGSGTGADTVSATLRKKIGDSFGSAIDVSNTNDKADFTLNYVTDVTPATVTVSVANDGTSTAEPLEVAATFAAHHAEVDLTADAPTVTTANSDNNITVTVRKADGTVLVGAPVTISAAGALFKEVTTGSTNVFTVGSVTSITDANGQVVVAAYGQKAGKVTFTATAGSVSKTADVTYAAAAASAGATIKVNAPTTVGAGKTFRVSGTLTDKYGNPVQISTAGTGGNPTLSVTWDGPGFVNGVLPTTTDATGTFFFWVLLGTNDGGSGTVTASYDADGTTTTKSAITATAGITLGAPADSVVIGSFNGRVAVRVEGVKGQKLSVKVGTKWYVVASVPSDRYVWSVKSRKGAVVKVNAYINGDLENTQTITVK